MGARAGAAGAVAAKLHCSCSGLPWYVPVVAAILSFAAGVIFAAEKRV